MRLAVSINILVSRRFATYRLVQCNLKHIETNHYQHKESQVAQIQCGAALTRSFFSKIFKIDTPSLARESEIICTMYMYKYIYGIYSMGILFSMQATITQKLWAFETITQKDLLGIGLLETCSLHALYLFSVAGLFFTPLVIHEIFVVAFVVTMFTKVKARIHFDSTMTLSKTLRSTDFLTFLSTHVNTNINSINWIVKLWVPNQWCGTRVPF